MHSSAEISPGLLEKLYLSAVDDEQMKPFLSELALAFNASLATVATMDGLSRHDNLRISSGVNVQETASAVPGYYAARSPFRPIMLLENNFGRVMTSAQMVDRERRERDVFINEFLKPADHQYLVTGVFAKSADKFNYFVLNRGACHGEFGEDTAEELERIVPHFRTMLRLRNTMVTRDRHIDFSRMIAERSGDGMVLITRHGKVHSMNAQATALLAEEDGLSLDGTELVADFAEDSDRLKRAIHTLLQHGRAQIADPAVSLAIRRRSGAQPYRLHIMPLAIRKYYFAGDEIELAIQIVGRQTSASQIDDGMAAQFGLSPAEVRVATHLAAGISPKQIADLLGNSINTIKVHRRNLYRKLGISRHFDLVRMIDGKY